MSPAIDATVRIPRAPSGGGEIFKDVEEEENVGGKGINVARWLALRGEKVACGGLLGEENDAPFVRELRRYGIEDRFARVAGGTRRNEMVVWPGGAFKMNRAAFPLLGAGDFAEPPAPPPVAGGGCAVAVVSGSLPAAAPRDFYARTVAALNSLGWTTVLDASGEAMRLGLEARPHLVKPNADECEALVGFVPRTPDEFRAATDALRGLASHAIISDGASGAWFDGEFVAAPQVAALDTTAAGDTLLAEYCHRLFGRGEDPGAAARWAVAAGSAACTMPGGAPPPAELVGRLSAFMA